MKLFITRILALIGILAIGFLCLYVLIEMNGLKYKETVIEEFGSPEAINAIHELYEKIDKNYDDTDFLAFDRRHDDYSQTKNVPKKWIPKEFPYWGSESKTQIPFWGDVLAFYDKERNLLGIEFYGSRYGCFVSRSPHTNSSSFVSLHRISNSPLYVTARITGGD